MPPRTLGPRMPPRITKLYDLRGAMIPELVLDTLATMLTAEPVVIGVTGLSKADPRVVVEVVLDERPLAEELWAYFRRVLVISIFISVTTAALVYATLQWLAVRPLRRITASMTAFQDDPHDPRRIIAPEARSDEVGTAERALSGMQRQLRALLLEKERLAGVGFAVTKISHDLKNILATAQLESDRLEHAPNVDPDVKHITHGIIRAIDRAVKLSANTIRFAREGVPAPRKRLTSLAAVLAEMRAALAAAAPGAVLTVDVPDAAVFAGDAELLQRALENLVRNAAEAGAGRIAIAYERDAAGPALTVSDDGPGLPGRAVDNLFVPFSGSARAGGTGLGLPIAREALRVQGGDIVLRATSGAGTTFAVLLPVA
jgi:signal transduction histidine kinase